MGNVSFILPDILGQQGQLQWHSEFRQLELATFEKLKRKYRSREFLSNDGYIFINDPERIESSEGGGSEVLTLVAK